MSSISVVPTPRIYWVISIVKDERKINIVTLLKLLIFLNINGGNNPMGKNAAIFPSRFIIMLFMLWFE
jgi:hypothetical protein